jgi:hypothetical protein
VSPAGDSAAYLGPGSFCMRTTRELASLVIEQAFQMLADTVRGLQIDEALFIPPGSYRSTLGTLKRIAGWSHVYRSYAFDAEPTHWAHIDWIPERRFGFVRTGLECVPRRLRPELVRHLLDATVAPEGRLSIGAHSEVAGSEPQLQAEVAGWGPSSIAGAVEVPHAQDDRVVRRAFWLDRSAR